MKLGPLRSAIRAADTVKVSFNLGGKPIRAAFQKGPLLQGLGDAFDNNRSAETGLELNPEGYLVNERGHEWNSHPDEPI